MSKGRIYDPLSPERGKTADAAVPRPPIQFRTFDELLALDIPPDDYQLSHKMLARGSITTLVGPPGTGKSHAFFWLACLLAEGRGSWFGFDVLGPSRVMMIQDENPDERLHGDAVHYYQSMIGVEGRKRLLVSAQPEVAMHLSNPAFVAHLCNAAHEFGADCLMFDPWTACVEGDTPREFAPAMAGLRDIERSSADGNGGRRPSIMILHHPRKLREGDAKLSGRELAERAAGTFQLGGKNRVSFFLMPASSDMDDSRVVLSVTKQNLHRRGFDPPFEKRSAWRGESGVFTAIPDFNWEEYESGGGAVRESKVKFSHLAEVFKGGKWMPLKNAAELLQNVASCGRSAAYEALKMKDGRFSERLLSENGVITFAAGNPPEDE